MGLLAVSCLVISSSSSFSVSWSWLSGLSTCVVGSSKASMAGSSALAFFFFFSLGRLSAGIALRGKRRRGAKGSVNARIGRRPDQPIVAVRADEKDFRTVRAKRPPPVDVASAGTGGNATGWFE